MPPIPTWIVAIWAMLPGASALCALLAWDARLQRRQAPADDAGINIFRSDHEDATEADLLGLVDAIRATPDVPLSAPPPRREPPMISRSPYAYRPGWRTPPPPPALRPAGHGPDTLQFLATAVAETGRMPELGPNERPTWATWNAAELPLLVEVP